MKKFRQFIGQQIKDVADQIEHEAKRRGLSVSFSFSDGIGNIDIDPKRLNVHIDMKTDTITKFTKG